jgi:hypothetical protein
MGNTGCGKVAPLAAAGDGGFELEFMRRSWMATSMRNFAGAEGGAGAVAIAFSSKGQFVLSLGPHPEIPNHNASPATREDGWPKFLKKRM